MDKRGLDLITKFYDINQGIVDKKCLDIFYKVVGSLFSKDCNNVFTVPYTVFKIENGLFVEVKPSTKLISSDLSVYEKPLAISDDVNTVKTFSFKYSNPNLDTIVGVVVDNLEKIFSECSVVLLYSINIIIAVDEKGIEKLICKYRMV